MKTSIPDAEWRDPYTGLTLREMDERVKSRRDAMLKQALGVRDQAKKLGSEIVVYRLYARPNTSFSPTVYLPTKRGGIPMEIKERCCEVRLLQSQTELRAEVEELLNDSLLYQKDMVESWDFHFSIGTMSDGVPIS